MPRRRRRPPDRPIRSASPAVAWLLGLLLGALLADRLLTLRGRGLGPLGLFEQALLLGLVLLHRHDLARRVDRLALAGQALFARLRGLRTGRGHLADDEELLPIVHRLLREPVDDDAEREEDAREDEGERAGPRA